MSTVRSALLGAVVLAGLARLSGCAHSPSSATKASDDPALAREAKAVDALGLKRDYKDVIMGTDVKGDTLVLYVDVNNLYSMDEPSENAMIAKSLDRWKGIWAASHPGRHTRLRVSLRDYYGNEILFRSTRT